MSCPASVLTLAVPSSPPARWMETTLSSSSCKALSHQIGHQLERQRVFAKGLMDSAVSGLQIRSFVTAWLHHCCICWAAQVLQSPRPSNQMACCSHDRGRDTLQRLQDLLLFTIMHGSDVVVAGAAHSRRIGKEGTHLAQRIAEPSQRGQHIAEIPRHLCGDGSFAHRFREQGRGGIKQAEAVRMPKRVWGGGRNSKLPKTSRQHCVSPCSAQPTHFQHLTAFWIPVQLTMTSDVWLLIHTVGHASMRGRPGDYAVVR